MYSVQIKKYFFFLRKIQKMLTLGLIEKVDKLTKKENKKSRPRLSCSSFDRLKEQPLYTYLPFIVDQNLSNF